MNRFVQLFADIAKLWGKYGESYLVGMGNTLILALVAVALAMVNVAGGFTLTHSMLSRFVKKGDKKDE